MTAAPAAGGAQVLLATIGAGAASIDRQTSRRVVAIAGRQCELLAAALAARGLAAEVVAWDAPVDWSQAELVVVCSPWDYVERHEEFLAWVRATAAATTLVNDPNLIAWNLYKGYLGELGAAGVPVVPTSLLARGTAAAGREAALAAHGDEVVIKPAISAGARGTLRAAAASEQAAAHLAVLLVEGDALLQPYLPDVETGEVSLMCFGGVLSHAVRKRPADGDFRVQEEHGGTLEPHVATAAERGVADAVLQALPAAACYARIDLVTTAAGPLLMEAELIEPELFLALDPAAAGRYADVLAELLRGPAASRSG